MGSRQGEVLQDTRHDVQRVELERARSQFSALKCAPWTVVENNPYVHGDTLDNLCTTVLQKIFALSA